MVDDGACPAADQVDQHAAHDDAVGQLGDVAVLPRRGDAEADCQWDRGARPRAIGQTRKLWPKAAVGARDAGDGYAIR